MALAGMETATKAAAVGGITTVVDMPLNNDPTTTTAALVEKKVWTAKVRSTTLLPGWARFLLPDVAPMRVRGCL